MLFEALPIEDSDTPWLVHHFACSYAYSATLLQEQMEMKTKSPKYFFAGFAADYSQFDPEKSPIETKPESLFAEAVRSGKYILPNAKEEVNKIASCIIFILALGIFIYLTIIRKKGKGA